MDSARSDGSTSPGLAKSGASVPEEIEMKDMTTSGGGQSSGAGTSTGGVSSQAGGPVVRSSSTTPSGSSSSPRKSATSGQRPTGGEEIELSAVSVTTSDRTSGSSGSQSSNGRIGPNPFAVAHAWWQYRTLKQKLMCVLKLVGIIVVVVLLVGLLLSIRFKGPSTSTTTHPFANESTSGLPSEWAPVSPVDSSTADLPITAMPTTEPTAAVDEEATSGSSHSAEPPIPGSSQGTEAPIPEPTYGTEEPTPGSSHGTKAPIPGSTHGTEAPIPEPTYGTEDEEPTPGPTHGTEAPTPSSTHSTKLPTRGFTERTKSSTPGFTRGTEAPTPGTWRDIEPPTPGLTQGTEAPAPESTVPTINPARLYHESELMNRILNYRADPCDNFYAFVCSNNKDYNLESLAFISMIRRLKFALEDERNHRHNLTRQPYPIAMTLIVDLYFESCRDRSQEDIFCLKDIFKHHAMVLTRLYVDYRTNRVNSAAFLQGNRMKAEKLFFHLKASFREDIEKYITWMDWQTRSKAIKRLDNMKLALGFFTNLFDNEFLNYLYNIKNNNYPNYLSHTMTTQEKLDKLQERKKNVVAGQLHSYRYNNPYWNDLLADFDEYMGGNSAAYSRHSNVLIAQIFWLDEPLFGDKFAAYFNFGGFGTVLGHEISHAFDITGSRRMMSPQMRAFFDEQTQCFVNQYNNLPHLGWDAQFEDVYRRNYTTLGVNGQKTKDENVADAGALKIAYYAFRRYLKNGFSADAPLLHSPVSQFTDYQMFFISNALVQCEAPVTTANYVARVWDNQGVHSPRWHRVNMPMCNFDRFSEAFNCPATSRMNYEQKCVIW